MKSWWKSKTILGALTMFVCMAIQKFVPEAALEENEVLDILTQLGEIVGVAMAIYGRVTAKTLIRS